MKIFLGPPGTGKTTRLLRVVEDELHAGVRPHEIAFVAFTRKAAHEARTRAMEKFGYTEDQLPFFRTLHSLAFKQLGLSPDQVLGNKDYQEIGHAIGMTFGDVYDEDDENALPPGPADKRGNNCAYIDQIARLTCQELKATCITHGLERYYDVKLYRDTLQNYKSSRRKIDFTDMMELYAYRGDVPPCRVIIIDEAQDLTPLQWRIIARVTACAERVYIAGDDDQAIYEWAGADVNHFLNLEGDKEVLPISYRLPQAVFAKATQVLNSIRRRYKKEWTPRDDKGAVHYYNEPEQADYREGSWLLLCRNRYMMSSFCAMLKRRGYPYVMHGKSSVDNENVKALLAWETLRSGGQITFDAAKLVCRKLRPGLLPTPNKALNDVGADEMVTLTTLEKAGLTTREDWMSALKIPDNSREYYRSVRRNGESFMKWPRIIVSTIHQAKGGEADNVLVTPDISDACYQGTKTNPDIEGRVFYVAVTRAKKALHIIHPRSNKYYELRGNA